MIRELITSDLPVLMALEEATQAAPWSNAIFLRCLEAKYPGWVIVEADKVVGFTLMSLIAGECHILNLCIHPKFQRRGFGRQLLEHALAWAKKQGAGMVYLEVRRSNLPAIQLYLHMDFNQIGERKNYYPGPNGKKEDALVYARDIGMEAALDNPPDFINTLPPLKKDG